MDIGFTLMWTIWGNGWDLGVFVYDQMKDPSTALRKNFLAYAFNTFSNYCFFPWIFRVRSYGFVIEYAAQSSVES